MSSIHNLLLNQKEIKCPLSLEHIFNPLLKEVKCNSGILENGLLAVTQKLRMWVWNLGNVST